MRIFLIISFALLTACSGAADRRDARDMRKCERFGFEPETEGMAVCMMQTTMQRRAAAQAYFPKAF